jgi:glycosyltransferase involved in cell wall biosynthesis
LTHDNENNSLLVSVIIPCYNQAHFLHEAIESVLKQTYPHFEIIVVDDGSPDNASEVAARYPEVRCVRQQNQGLPSARNAGFRVSKGHYLLFLDSDDRLLPNALATAVSSLNSHPECGYVAGQINYIAHDGSPIPTLQRDCTTRPEDHYLQVLRFDDTWTPLAVMFRRSAFENVGGYDDNTLIKGAEDYDICLRIASKSSAYCYNEVSAEYRVHESSMSRNPIVMWKSVMNVLRSQRSLVKGNKRYEEAYDTGIQKVHANYFPKIVDQIFFHLIKKREWKKILDGTLLMVRHHPQGLVKYSYRRFYRVVSSDNKFYRAIKGKR